MKIVFPAITMALLHLLFMGRMDAASTPPPTPTPTPIAPPIPPPELALHDQLAATLSPVARAWVGDEAAKARKKTNLTEGTIRADIQTRFTGQSLTEADKNILLYVTLTEAARDMANDLGEMFNDFKKKHTENQNGTSESNANGNTKITLTPEETTQLQTAMRRRAQFMAAMASLMKKIAGTQGSVVGNLK